MKLEPEQRSLLEGEGGKALASAMKTLVEYGRAFGATRLVPIKSGHLAGSTRASKFKAYYEVLDRLLSEGARVKVPTTVNPRPGRELNLTNRLLFSKQSELENQFEALGVTPNYSCVCYDEANRPEPGDRLAWAESSAVQFANSVLGARTNRNSVLGDVCSAVTGYTPEFGYLLDENRRGRVLVRLQIGQMEPSALGFVLGQRLVNKVPVIEHYEFDHIDLKNLGGAMAASGAVAMFHVEGLTPEAPDLRTAFDGEPESTFTISQREIDALRTHEPHAAEIVVFGCPQMTFEEATQLGEHFTGKRVSRRTWFCMVPAAKKRFEAAPLGQQLREAGVELHTHCPLAALTFQLKRKKVLTNSGKLYYYLQDSTFGCTEDCLRTCGATP
jgi:predicted aconitase